MKKNQFIKLLYSVVAGLLFSLGMCMCLLPQWDLFVEGIIITAIGAILLIGFGIVSFIKNHKNRAPINWKLVFKVAYCVFSTLILGLSLCMIMVWELMIFGIIVGIIGIIMILFSIPMFIGFKN